MAYSDILQNASFNFDPLGFAGGLIGAGIGAFQNFKNLQFQREAYDYQKWLNTKIMEREDSAVQRKVEDLKKAGLSPYLAVGSSASTGSYSAGSAPMSNFQMPQFNSNFSIMSKQQLQQMKAQTELLQSQAEIEKSKADAVGKNPMLLFQDNWFSRMSALRQVFPNLFERIEDSLDSADSAFQSPKGTSLQGIIQDYLNNKIEEKQEKKENENTKLYNSLKNTLENVPQKLKGNYSLPSLDKFLSLDKKEMNKIIKNVNTLDDLSSPYKNNRR